MALALLDDVKEFLGITSTVNNSLIESFIELVSAEVEAFVDRNLEEASYTNEILRYKRSEYDPNPNQGLDVYAIRPQVFLDNTPARNLTLTYKGSTVSEDDYELDGDSGVITLYKGFSDYKDSFTATYTAGYTTVTGSQYTVPRALQLVVMEGVKIMYANSGTTNQGSGDIKSKTIKDFSVSYGNQQTASYTSATSGSGSALVKTYLQANQITLRRYMRVNI